MESVYRIKNWQTFQHFKDRNPPWIKLYREIIDDPDWHNLDDKAAKTLVMLWLLASEDKERQGRLPCLHKMAFRLRMPEKALESILSKLCHWVDITPISPRYRDDAPETETETETETEEISCEAPDKPESSREVALRILDFLNQKTGRSFRAYEGTNGKRKPTASMELVLSRLKAGATEEDMKGVIARKVRQWGGDPKMEKFLRPVTLFSRTNYDQYVGEQEGV